MERWFSIYRCHGENQLKVQDYGGEEGEAWQRLEALERADPMGHYILEPTPECDPVPGARMRA